LSQSYQQSLLNFLDKSTPLERLESKGKRQQQHQTIAASPPTLSTIAASPPTLSIEDDDNDNDTFN
jgi:hypothetical protein